jgi:ligand-binding sensor domain-containing protein
LQPGWHTFTTDDGLANEAVHALIATPDGAVWFGTSDGITFYLPETTAE